MAETTEETTVPTEAPTEAPTAAPDVTEAPTEEGYGEPDPIFPGDTMPTEKQGCGSVVGFGVTALLVAMAAAVAMKKKGE